MDRATTQTEPIQTLPEPRIIPRSEHTISRKNIDPDALKVLYRLQRHGFIAYLVGGSVRDLLLGKRPKDFDVGTDAHPSQIRRLFHNSRIIGRRFRLVQVFFTGNKIVEVSTFRRASDPGDDDVLQANNTFGSPVEDALRRDLSINALFYNVADFSVVDYVGGLEDLKAGLIRSVGDPMVRFHRDPVRVLRAIRHAARAGFRLTPETTKAVESLRGELAVCPSSRIRDELMRDLKGGAAGDWLELAHQTGVLYSLLPSLEEYYGGPDNPDRAEARRMLAVVDRKLAAGQEVDEAVVVGALLWPALKRICPLEEVPPGRAGRGKWTIMVREALPVLTQPVAFPKRVVERACQISSVMGFAHAEEESLRLPKKITEKGYFNDALELADLLGVDLKSLAQEQKRQPSKKRRRRRRRRPKKQEVQQAN